MATELLKRCLQYNKVSSLTMYLIETPLILLHKERSGSMVECLTGFEPHQRHYVVVLEQDTFILA